MVRGARGRLSSVHAWFEIASASYLALPIALFAYGWLKLPVALLIFASLIIFVWVTANQRETIGDLFSFREHAKTLIIIGLVLTVWVVISGAGELGSFHQSTDYNKHNAVISDLVTHTWPVEYSSKGSTHPLVYYIAFYLPPAAIGKIFSSVWLADKLVLPWLLAGMVLVLYWACRLCKRPSVGLLLLLIFFSGMDVLGQVIIGKIPHTIPLLNIYALIEGYASAIGLNYPANTTLLYWQPQHALAGWLIGAILVAAVVEKRQRTPVLTLLAVGFLWSPLAMIGTLPVLVAYIFLHRKSWRKLLWPSDVIPAVFIGITVSLYLQAGNTKQPGGLFLSFGDASLVYKFVILIIFMLLEFLIFAFLIRRFVFRSMSVEWRTLYVCCVGWLTVLPLLHYGLLNDLVMRASIISLLVLSLLVYHYLLSNKDGIVGTRNVIAFALVAGCIALGAVNALIELNVHVRGPVGNTHYWESIDAQNINVHDRPFANQYLGRNNSLFMKHLARLHDE